METLAIGSGILHPQPQQKKIPGKAIDPSKGEKNTLHFLSYSYFSFLTSIVNEQNDATNLDKIWGIISQLR